MANKRYPGLKAEEVMDAVKVLKAAGHSSPYGTMIKVKGGFATIVSKDSAKDGITNEGS